MSDDREVERVREDNAEYSRVLARSLIIRVVACCILAFIAGWIARGC